MLLTARAWIEYREIERWASSTIHQPVSNCVGVVRLQPGRWLVLAPHYLTTTLKSHNTTLVSLSLTYIDIPLFATALLTFRQSQAMENDFDNARGQGEGVL
jgi:hypothetical protein